MFTYFNQFHKVSPQKGFTTIPFASRPSLARSRVGVLENKFAFLSKKVSLDCKADFDTTPTAKMCEGPVYCTEKCLKQHWSRERHRQGESWTRLSRIRHALNAPLSPKTKTVLLLSRNACCQVKLSLWKTRHDLTMQVVFHTPHLAEVH